MCVAFRGMALAAVLATCVTSHALAADLWHIKCFKETGHTISVKAIAADGSTYGVKAIPGTNPGLLDVKAIEPELGPYLNGVVSQNWIVANLTRLRGSSDSEVRRVFDAAQGVRDLGGRWQPR